MIAFFFSFFNAMAKGKKRDASFLFFLFALYSIYPLLHFRVSLTHSPDLLATILPKWLGRSGHISILLVSYFIPPHPPIIPLGWIKATPLYSTSP